MTICVCVYVYVFAYVCKYNAILFYLHMDLSITVDKEHYLTYLVEITFAASSLDLLIWSIN